jgi:K+-transporting ATPase KdpF subunit
MESPGNGNILHDFYVRIGNICRVFPHRGLFCKHGFPLHRGSCGPFGADARLARRMRGAGAKKVTWAYALSGVISFALLIYLIAALIRAEDL